MRQGLRLVGGEIAGSLRGIAALTFGKAAGLRAFGNDLGVARRSFVTPFFALPIFVVLRFVDWVGGTAPLEGAHAFALDLLTFIIGWAGFALISRPLVRMLAQERDWPRYIAVWNWSNVAQYCLLLVTSLPVLFHAPAMVAETIALVGFGWALWLEWYVTKLSLDVTPTSAALIVAADVGLGAVLSLLTLVPFNSLSL
ncbi:hypothetical protein [Acidisoma cladoniae]|jgi:hypothetical protein|uniref:hypothetical protein n=1 Tax=Acidisoma cladoniae TaxID=3040935 RepID=UPI002550C9D1|nr:hypothetical protein [Acidisoma sp. PAMC 29798]